mmetsp:Transcript_28642/g.42518  ORF Transcript_28642/g.42518 Transcript_28642/m.42518 type:complete len:387 (+) Transcript_28642:39-1199(+)
MDQVMIAAVAIQTSIRVRASTKTFKSSLNRKRFCHSSLLQSMSYSSMWMKEVGTRCQSYFFPHGSFHCGSFISCFRAYLANLNEKVLSYDSKMSVFQGSIASADFDRIYEAGQAISQSNKFEVWRARHRNVHIIGDLKPYQMFLTYVRDSQTTGEDFVNYADLLMRFLLSYSYNLLPCEKQIVTTSSGYKYKGPRLPAALDTNTVAFVMTTESHPEWLGPFAEVLGACFPGASVGELAVSWPDEWEPDVVWRWHTPSPKRRVGRKGGLVLKGCTAVLLCPIVATGISAEIAINQLIGAGTEPKNIILTSMVISMEGLAYLSEQFPRVQFVVGEVDPEVDGGGLTVPGMGNFVQRYMDHRKGLAHRPRAGVPGVHERQLNRAGRSGS